MNAGEVVSENLLIAMVMKGLPDDFKSFCTVATQRDECYKFSDFKVAIKNFEETEKSRNKGFATDNVMKIRSDRFNDKITCYNCGQKGHKKFKCPNKNNSSKYKSRWCENCKSKTHDTDYCKKNNVNNVKEKFENHNYTAFKLNVDVTENKAVINKCNMLLVDCGATAHIVCDRKKFLSFDKNCDTSSHVIELADGSQQSGIVCGRGTAHFELTDTDGNTDNVLLKNSLCSFFFPGHLLSTVRYGERGRDSI